MKFSCPRPELYEIVSNVSRAVSGKTALTVLEGILIRAKGGVLSFLGYDLDLGISAQMSAQIEEEGEIVLSAKLFVDMMRRMNGDTVTIRTDEKYLTEIKSGATEFTILGIPSDEFPEIPVVQEEQSIRLPQHLLKGMIDQTLFAISTNDSKPVHTGSLFQLEDGELRVVSVDGFRLALRREKVSAEGTAQFIIPGKTLSEMTKLLSEDEEEEAGFSLPQACGCADRSVSGDFPAAGRGISRLSGGNSGGKHHHRHRRCPPLCGQHRKNLPSNLRPA